MNSAMDILAAAGRAHTPYIPQSEASECALACLAMIASHHGYQIDLGTLRQRFNVSLKGATLVQVSAVAEALGLHAKALQASLDELRHITLPSLLHWDLNHFVVLVECKFSIRGARYKIHDPAKGILVLSDSELSGHYTGVALEFHKNEEFHPAQAISKINITQLWSKITGIGEGLRSLIFLSIILQLIVLATPFYLQLAVDEALPSADDQLLLALAIGFGGLCCLNLLVSWLRTIIVQSFSNALSYQIINNLFRHLIHLPMSWFEKRHIGDIISRFGSTQPISQLLSQGMVTGFIDGLLALTTLAIMVVYLPLLAALPIVALLLYVSVRFAFLRSLRFRNIDAISTAARENSLFIETARGIQAIKIFGQENNRSLVWAKAKAAAVNAQLRLATLSGGFDALSQFVIGLEQVVFVYLAIRLAIGGEITIGMIFAFQSYKQQFINAGVRLAEQFINWRIVQVHLGRISDIALSPKENPHHKGVNFREWDGSIELRNIYFRYGIGDPEILRGVHLHIPANEFLVLIGPSGGGKTTLAKIVLGLIAPTYGEVIFSDRPLHHYSLDSFRASIAAVAQDDVLYGGTIAENISFWDPEIDMNRVHEVSRLACIHDDIMKMPLGYDTLVGDMGSALSGGQKARIFIARALYRRPKILMLDEATAQLDPGTEKAVLENLSKLEIIRIFVTHRSQPTHYADRVVRISEGRAKQVMRTASNDLPLPMVEANDG